MPKRQYDTDDDLIDERGFLRDGGRIGSDDDAGQRRRSHHLAAEGDHFAPARVVDSLGNDGLALCKPGARHLTAGAGTGDHARLVTADHMRREARDQYVADLQDAWKGNNSDREVAHIHNTGDARTDACLDQKYDLENSWHRGTGKR